MVMKGIACLLIESSRSRAYIQKLVAHGLKPERVVLFKATNRSRGHRSGDDGQTAALIDAAFAGRKYFLYDKAMKESSLLEVDALEEVSYETFDNNEPVRETLTKHSIDYAVVEAPSINAPNIIAEVKAMGPDYVVFGGGGILRHEILSQGKKFIHCHPGWLPEFRGSHCIEWSILLSGQCAVTCFVMNEEIDGGAIIAQKKFAPPRLAGGIPPLYSAHIRSEVLLDVIGRYFETGEFPSVKQNMGEGQTYYKMHPALTNIVFHRLAR
jgi:methionyl-tRNA formyltransferase